jgi:hypothetical protein
MRAEEHAVKRFPLAELPARAEPVQSSPEPVASQPGAYEMTAAELRGEYALRYCPVCSQRLESRRCKLICNLCGYYMSCADYI